MVLTFRYLTFSEELEMFFQNIKYFLENVRNGLHQQTGVWKLSPPSQICNFFGPKIYFVEVVITKVC